MIYLVHGEDSFSSNEFLKELLDAIGPEDLRESNLTHIDNNVFTTATLGAACMVAPFLANRRMAIVHGALSSGENRSRTRRAKGKKTTVPEGLQDLLVQLPSFSDVVFFENRLAAKNELHDLITSISNSHGNVSIKEFRPLRREAMFQWVIDRTHMYQAKITNDANESLVDRIGSNLWVLNSEIEKLSIYCSNGTITIDAVNELVTRIREANIFDLVDAIMDRKYAKALKTTQQLFYDGQTGTYLLSMIASQARKIAIAQELLEKNVSPHEWGPRIGTQSDFVIRKTENQAKRFSKEAIIQFYSMLLKTDISIKSSSNDEIALTELIAESVSLPHK